MKDITAVSMTDTEQMRVNGILHELAKVANRLDLRRSWMYAFGNTLRGIVSKLDNREGLVIESPEWLNSFAGTDNEKVDELLYNQLKFDIMDFNAYTNKREGTPTKEDVMPVFYAWARELRFEDMDELLYALSFTEACREILIKHTFESREPSVKKSNALLAVCKAFLESVNGSSGKTNPNFYKAYAIMSNDNKTLKEMGERLRGRVAFKLQVLSKELNVIRVNRQVFQEATLESLMNGILKNNVNFNSFLVKRQGVWQVHGEVKTDQQTIANIIFAQNLVSLFEDRPLTDYDRVESLESGHAKPVVNKSVEFVNEVVNPQPSIETVVTQTSEEDNMNYKSFTVNAMLKEKLEMVIQPAVNLLGTAHPDETEVQKVAAILAKPLDGEIRQMSEIDSLFQNKELLARIGEMKVEQAAKELKCLEIIVSNQIGFVSVHLTIALAEVVFEQKRAYRPAMQEVIDLPETATDADSEQKTTLGESFRRFMLDATTVFVTPLGLFGHYR